MCFKLPSVLMARFIASIKPAILLHSMAFRVANIYLALKCFILNLLKYVAEYIIIYVLIKAYPSDKEEYNITVFAQT